MIDQDFKEQLKRLDLELKESQHRWGWMARIAMTTHLFIYCISLHVLSEINFGYVVLLFSGVWLAVFVNMRETGKDMAARWLELRQDVYDAAKYWEQCE